MTQERYPFREIYSVVYKRSGVRIRLCNYLNSNSLLEKSQSQVVPKFKSISMPETDCR